jgi:hypothetical protein
MVAGELTRPDGDETELPAGAVHTPSGRVSSALDVGRQPLPDAPFNTGQMARLDEALTLVSRHTRLRFSIYLGDLGGPAREEAAKLHDQLPDNGLDSVLIAVDPTRKQLAIITGGEARVRLPDRACHLAVMSMTASFSEGDLVGGLLSGLRMLSDQAGAPA